MARYTLDTDNLAHLEVIALHLKLDAKHGRALPAECTALFSDWLDQIVDQVHATEAT